MSLTIGRASGLRPSFGLVHTNRSVVFEGVYQGSSAMDVEARRQQLLGMAEPGEEVVPVLYPEDLSVTGYYRVTNVDVQRRKPLGNNSLTFRVEAEKVDAYYNPQIEGIATVVVVSNAVSLPTSVATGVIWLPGVDLREASSPGNGFDSGQARTNTAESASAIVWPSTSVSTGTKRWNWYTPPDHFYDGGCSIAIAGGGSGFYPLVGRNAIALGQESPPSTFRLSTGVTTLTWAQASPSVYTLAWTDGSGAVSQAWRFGTTTDSVFDQVVAFRIVRNRPETVTIRLTLKRSTSTISTLFTVDITAKRGARFFDLVFNGAASRTWFVERTTVVASTAITGGIRSTSTSGGTNAYSAAAATVAQTNDLVNGRLQATAASTRFHCCIVGLRAGSAGAATTTAQGEFNQWIHGVSEWHRIVAR